VEGAVGWESEVVEVLPGLVTWPNGARMHRHRFCRRVTELLGGVKVVVVRMSMILGAQTGL
jgi:hypothetical protein